MKAAGINGANPYENPFPQKQVLSGLKMKTNSSQQAAEAIPINIIDFEPAPHHQGSGLVDDRRKKDQLILRKTRKSNSDANQKAAQAPKVEYMVERMDRKEARPGATANSSRSNKTINLDSGTIDAYMNRRKTGSQYGGNLAGQKLLSKQVHVSKNTQHAVISSLGAYQQQHHLSTGGLSREASQQLMHQRSNSLEC